MEFSSTVHFVGCLSTQWTRSSLVWVPEMRENRPVNKLEPRLTSFDLDWFGDILLDCPSFAAHMAWLLIETTTVAKAVASVCSELIVQHSQALWLARAFPFILENSGESQAGSIYPDSISMADLVPAGKLTAVPRSGTIVPIVSKLKAAGRMQAIGRVESPVEENLVPRT
jgi:hypothetical protein